MYYPHVPEQYQPLLEEWEAILRDEKDPNHTCMFCGEAIPVRGTRGPRKLYCGARCRQAAARRRKVETYDSGEWIPSESTSQFFADADADGADYVDAYPGDHPPLNYPVVPRASEASSWAWEIIGSADVVR